MKKRGRLGVFFDGRLLEQGSWKQTNWKQGILWDWSGEDIWLSLIDPKLKAGVGGTKIREVGSHWPSPKFSGLVATEIEVWLPALVAAEVAEQNCIIICDLAIFHLYIISWPSLPDIHPY